VVPGLEGELPETVDTALVPGRMEAPERHRRLRILGRWEIEFEPRRDLVFHRRKTLPFHPNGLRFQATDAAGQVGPERVYYSVGGGFVVDEEAAGAGRIVADTTPLPYPFATAAELLAHCAEQGLSVSGLLLANERAWRPEKRIRAGLLNIWAVMRDCVDRGCQTEGVLPGGMKIKRRAPRLYRQLR
jgi:L-serine dehydratase